MEISSIGSSATPKNYNDFLKPAAMKQSAAIYKKIQLVKGNDAIGAVLIAQDLHSQILQTKSSGLKDLWTRIEKTLHRRKPLKTTAKDEQEQLVMTLGLVYNAMETADKGDQIRMVGEINTYYLDIKRHISSRFIGKVQGMEKRILQRSLDTIDSFFERVIKRFNQRVKDNEIAGPEIAV